VLQHGPGERRAVSDSMRPRRPVAPGQRGHRPVARGWRRRVQKRRIVTDTAKVAGFRYRIATDPSHPLLPFRDPRERTSG
jgi:hypothetical protein